MPPSSMVIESAGSGIPISPFISRLFRSGGDETGLAFVPCVVSVGVAMERMMSLNHAVQ